VLGHHVHEKIEEKKSRWEKNIEKDEWRKWLWGGRKDREIEE
jgi:hypothetical protein